MLFRKNHIDLPCVNNAEPSALVCAFKLHSIGRNVTEFTSDGFVSISISAISHKLFKLVTVLQYWTENVSAEIFYLLREHGAINWHWRFVFTMLSMGFDFA